MPLVLVQKYEEKVKSEFILHHLLQMADVNKSSAKLLLIMRNKRTNQFLKWIFLRNTYLNLLHGSETLCGPVRA